MRTEEAYFVQAVEREIPCQCERRCINKPPPNSLTQVGPRPAVLSTHESPEQHATCVTRYVAEFVTERIRELRSSSKELPPNVYLLYADDMSPGIYADVTRAYKLVFTETMTELDGILISNFRPICAMAVQRASVST